MSARLIDTVRVSVDIRMASAPKPTRTLLIRQGVDNVNSLYYYVRVGLGAINRYGVSGAAISTPLWQFVAWHLQTIHGAKNFASTSLQISTKT